MRRSWFERALLALNALSVVAALGLAYVLRQSYGQVQSIERVALAGSLSTADDAEPGERIVNFLLVGYDSSAGLDPDDPIQTNRGDQRLADAIIVVHLDEVAGTAAMVSFPRDLWVEIGDTGISQRINYAYGVGGPANLIETIEANFGIPIHHFAAVDFAGFEGLVEAVGSVDVSFPQPARDWNVTTGASQTGFEVLTPGCHALDPETALAYVRSRYYQVQDSDGRWRYTTPSSDLGRIIRQQAFLQSLMREAIDRGARNPLVLSDLVDVGLENVTIDSELTPQLLLDLGRSFNALDPDELATYSLPVYDQTVGTDLVLGLVEVDADPVLELFRGSAISDPVTIRVSVVGDAGGLADDVAHDLAEAGFDIDGASGAAVEPGVVVIRHGGDGAQAATVVATALTAADQSRVVALELTEALPGRTVVVRVGAALPETPATTLPSATESRTAEPSATEPVDYSCS
ncbi:MAG: LCP family protein [Acidimicrobiales bacterium]